MTRDRELDEILAEIGREHREIGAPERLEPVLRARACGRKDPISIGSLRSARAWVAAALVILAFATSGAIWQIRKAHRPPPLETRSGQTPPARPLRRLPSAPETARERAAGSAPARARVSGRAGRDVTAKWSTARSLDEFVPLPVSEGLAPAGELSVVRVELRGSDLQQYGLETPADSVAQTMLAEFLVGEDGLPRAIRILQ